MRAEGARVALGGERVRRETGGFYIPPTILGGVANRMRVAREEIFGPVLTAFVVLSTTMALWPAQKNLGTLLSCSSAVMVATQFWHGWGGGLYMAWFLPLILLTIFRPNLEDRVALAVLSDGYSPPRRPA